MLSLELHASPMRSGKNEWRKFKREERENAIVEALSVGVAQQNRHNVRLFGAVIRKSDLPADPAETAFTQLYNRFDQFLRRLHLSGNTQRGIMIFDKTSIEPRIQTLAREFKTSGHPWGHNRNYAEVPLFLDSKASRLIQLADLIAFAIFRHFEHRDSKYFDVIRHCFDEDGASCMACTFSSAMPDGPTIRATGYPRFRIGYPKACRMVVRKRTPRNNIRAGLKRLAKNSSHMTAR
ncbi:hypothetical protein CBA19C8_01630 [Paraburkholderia terrae]|nr:hypothetical protein CBA19C8_01630 [Paraburkholderia terrae]